MSSPRIAPVALATAAVLAALVHVPRAAADVYIYTDDQGRTNVTNMPPPEGARITKVVREAPPSAYNDAARQAAQRAEVANLAQRVDQLQGELAAAKAPPAAPATVAPQVVVVQAPPVVYAPAPAPAAAPAAECVWNTCDSWWNGAFGYPFATFVYAPPYGPVHGGRGGYPGPGMPRPPAPPARPGAPGPWGNPVIPAPHPLVKVAALAPN